MDGRNEFDLQDVKAFKNNWFRFSFVLRDPELVRPLKLKISILLNDCLTWTTENLVSHQVSSMILFF